MKSNSWQSTCFAWSSFSVTICGWLSFSEYPTILMYSLNERFLIILDHVSRMGLEMGQHDTDFHHRSDADATEGTFCVRPGEHQGAKSSSGFSLATTTDSYRSPSYTHFHNFLCSVSVSCHFFILCLKIFSRNYIPLVHSWICTSKPGKETLKPHSSLHFLSISRSSTLKDIQKEELRIRLRAVTVRQSSTQP